MSREKADGKRAETKRKVTLRGKLIDLGDKDPIAIARALRRNSPLAKREARLAAAEAKVRGAK